MNILLFLGTARQDRQSEYVAKFVKKITEERRDLQVDLVDPRNLEMAFEDEGRGIETPELTKKVIAADAYIIVSPEYNHSIPGSLKYTLDLHLKEYIHKPVSIVGVSAGPFGGARMIENLIPVLRTLGMVATFTDVNFSVVQDQFDEQGEIKDQDKWSKRVDKMLDELLWMAKVLEYGRKNLASKYHDKV